MEREEGRRKWERIERKEKKKKEKKGDGWEENKIEKQDGEIKKLKSRETRKSG